MVRELPADERPRERLLALGPGFLSNAELLAIVLRNGSRERSALQVAQEILGMYREEGVAALARMSAGELMGIRGIGSAKAAEIMAAVELGKRLNGGAARQRAAVTCPEDAAEYAMPRFRYEEREHFAVILLNVKNHILSMPVISIGSLTASVVHPREVFRAAIQQTAASIILVHNHPSGDPSPSREDIEITARLVQVGRVMDIPVLDHIILGNDNYISLKEQGVIK
ncbi:RadC family protein [Anaerovibrio sp.]|uniref:RadC family protein n=1 Tax=Anaerovibrio sp. TaxID=1872532 RepID=UPI003F1627DC